MIDLLGVAMGRTEQRQGPIVLKLSDGPSRWEAGPLSEIEAAEVLNFRGPRRLVQWQPDQTLRSARERGSLWTPWTSQAACQRAHGRNNTESGQFICYRSRTHSRVRYRWV